jgi:uncharacterized membrane protein YbhN (UPF0104 family)
MSGAKARGSVATVLLRAAVSVGLVAALLTWLPTGRLLGQIGRIGAVTWLLVVALFLGGHAISAMKWRMLIARAGAPVTPFVALRAHAAGLCANLCLPSIVGGDVIRAGLIVRSAGRLEAVALGSLADRLIDTTALLTIAGSAALLVAGLASPSTTTALVSVGSALSLAAVAGFVATRVLSTARVPPRLTRVAERVRQALDALLAAPGTGAAALALSLLVQGGFVGLNLVLARAIGLELPASVWMFAWPLAKLVALVPVSLGGIGVREVALAALLAPFGVEATLAVAQSLAWEAVLVIAGLLSGGVALALGGSLSIVSPQPEPGE